jgi:nucleoside-diphosphate-sugar epimerase
VEGILLVQALRVQAITIHGDGQQTRSFCTVDGQVHMIATGRQNSGPIHHGNSGAITIKPLAEEVNRLSGSS